LTNYVGSHIQTIVVMALNYLSTHWASGDIKMAKRTKGIHTVKSRWTAYVHGLSDTASNTTFESGNRFNMVQCKISPWAWRI